MSICDGIDIADREKGDFWFHETSRARSGASSFDSFSRQHQGWLASTEVGDKTAVRDLPLSGISADDEGIEVILGPAAERHVHSIGDPTRVALLENDDGGHAGVCIETADGPQYVVKFRVAARPEALDGLGGTVL